MRKHTGLILIALLAVLLTIPLGALAQDPTATPVPVPSATPAVAQSGTGTKEIVFWNGLTGSDGQTLLAMTERFVQENPDYTVHTEIMEWAVLYQKLQAALVAGDAPDVVVMHTGELQQFVDFGAFQPIDAFYGTGEGQLDPADFAPGSLEATMVDGQQYGVMLDNHGWGMWVNNALLEEAGIDPNDPPESWEEFIDYATRLTKDANGLTPADEGFDAGNIAQYGTALEWPRVSFLTLFYQNGGQLIAEDGTTDINGPAGVAALEMLQELIYERNVAPPDAGFDDWQNFAGGRVTMMPSGTWLRNFAADNNIDVTVWPYPQFAEQPATWMSAHVFYVPVTTQGEDLANVQTFVKWISDNNVDWAASGQIPARLSSQAELNPEEYPTNIIFAEAFNEFGRFDPPLNAINEVWAALDPEIDAAVNSNKPAQEALDAAAERINAILAR